MKKTILFFASLSAFYLTGCTNGMPQFLNESPAGGVQYTSGVEREQLTAEQADVEERSHAGLLRNVQ